MTRDSSKRDPWLVVVLLLEVAVLLGAAGLTVSADLPVFGKAALILACLAAAGFIVGVLGWTDYELGEDRLAIRHGPFRWKIPLDAIVAVTPTRSWLSSAALSADRLQVRYGPGGATVEIAPRDRDGFLRRLAELAPRLRGQLSSLSSSASCSDENPGADPASGPEAVVQAQLDAYNAHDIDAFVATYAEDVQLFEHPSTLLAAGHAQLRERYTPRFEDPILHCTLVKRIVLGSTVIDEELVVRTFPEGPGSVRAVAIYDVQAGRIAKTWLLRGPRVSG